MNVQAESNKVPLQIHSQCNFNWLHTSIANNHTISDMVKTATS